MRLIIINTINNNLKKLKLKIRNIKNNDTWKNDT